MTSLSLNEAMELLAKYKDEFFNGMYTVPSSDIANLTTPCSLFRSGFGAAVGRSWPLSPTECWVRLDITTLGQSNVPLPQADQLSLNQQLQMRRALVELICQLSATPSCRWAESFESLWWPAVLRPSDFKDEKYLEMVHDIWSKPRFALSTGRPTLESVHMLFQFLQMEHKKLLREEDWQLLRSLRMSTLKREKQRVEICFQLANHVVDTSILRSMADGLREYLVAKTSKEEDTDDYPQVEFEITALWFPNCRFLNGAEDLKLLALIVTLPSSIIRSLMLPGAFFNSLRNPAGLLGFQSFARQVLAPSSPLRSLDLTRVGIDSNCLASLCSALRYSSRLTKLSIGHTIRGAHMNSRLDWAWICLAVFHVDSGCEFAHFDASGLQLPTYVVEILTAMLASPHPGRTVLLLQDGCLPEGEGCEECELPPNARLFVRLLDGAQAWTSPGASIAWPQLLPETLQPSDFEYEVMVRLTDWLCILIPGYGFGWVEYAVVSRMTNIPLRTLFKKAKEQREGKDLTGSCRGTKPTLPMELEDDLME
ncbi:hypothetical protein PInf_018727 [Phytophthora infestans]|nr:hypothetical protein PInf_018727 [Phytophthora infestans]